MMKLMTLCVFIFVWANVHGQNYQILRDRLEEVLAISKSGSKEKLENWWAVLRDTYQIPLVAEDSVYFFYRSSAKTVEWIGDFNGWGYEKKFPNKGSQLEGTDIWILKASFPKDARLDYKIITDGTNWIIDPENKYQQWSGVGGGSPNSELRMPDWKEDPIQLARINNLKGTLISDQLLNSNILGYQITYSVYLPHSYTDTQKLPCIYVTDGYEYLHPKLGNITTVLDNLIEDKKIRAVVAVFIDHRSPIDRSNNRRMQELAMNAKYLDFFTQELIPQIDSEYAVIQDARHRAIMGTSMGGLTATYFAFAKPNIFGLAGIQSPSFYTRPQIYSLCSNQADPKMKISMTSGLINDTSTESRKMKDVLEANSCIYTFREVNEGHSWGNWRRLIDDILIDLFAQTD